MANKTVNSRIIIRNDTSTNWTSTNPVLLKGEIGIEANTNKFKIGDGVSTWTALTYASAVSTQISTSAPTVNDAGFDVGKMWLNSTTDRLYMLQDNTPGAAVWTELAKMSDVAAAGYGDMFKSLYATNAESATGYVDKAKIADKLTTPFTLSITGDGTGNASIDGSTDKSITFTLADSGVTIGTYTKVTVDAKGRITTGALLAASDVPTLTLAKISDAGTAAALNVGVSANNIPQLDSSGKLNTSVLPSLALTEIFPVATQAAMLALTAQPGDVAVRSDINKTFMLSATPASTLANWLELKSPTDAVTSVNSKTGTVVLATTDIAEGTNLYWTQARFNSAFGTAIAAAASTSLSDTAHILYDTDILVLDGGDA